MKLGPDIAYLASMIGDPSRANMLAALMSGQALTARELADSAGVQPSTASSHLNALKNAHLVTLIKQGRHHYYRLANEETAQALEALLVLTEHNGHARTRTGPKEQALREARVCYNHLAGDYGVQLYDSMVQRGFLRLVGDGLQLSQCGVDFVAKLGVSCKQTDVTRRPMCRNCLDWSVRRYHLAGPLATAILDTLLAKKWAKRDASSRAIIFNDRGKIEFDKRFPQVQL